MVVFGLKKKRGKKKRKKRKNAAVLCTCRFVDVARGGEGPEGKTQVTQGEAIGMLKDRLCWFERGGGGLGGCASVWVNLPQQNCHAEGKK